MPLPLLLAVTPLPSDAFVPFVPPPAASSPSEIGAAEVETFDPQGRAQLLARDLPRAWSGFYTPYGGGNTVPVQLTIESLSPMGQLIDVRGQIVIAGVSTPVQGNLNAKSDQLDLLLVGDNLPPGVEPGGALMGLQGFSLGAWIPPRLTSMGGRLEMTPQASAAPARPAPGSVRGLW